jgi:16S rRNA (guanine527-N7)-methyltransferase
VGSLGQPARDPDDLLLVGARDLGITLDPQAVTAFGWYRDETLRWSSHMSLTALETPQAIVREGFLDSLLCATLIQPGGDRILDIGSGAGFPAIPMALASPSRTFTLVEANRKKISFLRHIVRTLSLQHVEVIHARAEALATDADRAGRYDIVLARAVAAPAIQGALARPFLRVGGVYLAQLGPESARPEALEALETLGFERVGEAAQPAAWGRGDLRVVAFRLA